MTDAARAAIEADEGYMALGNERFQADGAVFVRNREIPQIWDANHVAHVTASTPQEIDRLLERMEREFEGCRHRRLHLDFTTPPEFEARLALEGYQRSDGLLLLLEGELNAKPPPVDIRPVEDESAWQAYNSLHEVDWREYHVRMPGTFEDFTEETAAQSMRARRGKSPPVRYWLAYVDDRPVAYLASWGGDNGVGQVEDLFTHPDYRRRGLASALIHHCLAWARRDGAWPVIIAADPNDTPKQMYAALGFRPVALKRNYMKRLDK